MTCTPTLLHNPQAAEKLATQAKTVTLAAPPADPEQLLQLLDARPPALVILDLGGAEARLLAGPRAVHACLCGPSGCEPARSIPGAKAAKARIYLLPRRLYAWSPEMSVYVKGIDLQHRQLVRAVNSLYEALLEGASRSRIGGLLGFLEEYTRFHFRTEERLFEKLGYPEAGRHRREHRWFMEQVAGFREEYRRDRQSLDLDVLLFLANWVKGHIMGSDKKYGRWIVEEGLAPLLQQRL